MKFIKGPDFPTGGIILQEGEENQLLAPMPQGRKGGIAWQRAQGRNGARQDSA